KPSKKDYRKFKIKTVVGPDDYASMREVLFRRYSRVKKEGLQAPNLIIVDGGVGQVNVAKDVIEKQLGLTIPVAGLQKNDKHQTHDLLFGNPLEVVPLPRRSEEFFLLHRIQDEVHRFAVTFHRQVRRKNSFSSTLDHISGLGPKRKQLLLRHFKTITAIASATSEEIQALGIPKTVVEAIQQQITDNKNDRSSP
ncbi:UvrC Helix-hairpin-helix N-terminal domain protein, partial [Streptococcus pyogenes GA40468]